MLWCGLTLVKLICSQCGDPVGVIWEMCMLEQQADSIEEPSAA